MKTIYRAEAIGSLLRPSYLWDARRALRSKEITTAQFKKVEDRAVDDAIELQVTAGLDVVTDGEMRRVSFIGPLSDVIAGLEPMPLTRPWHEGGKLIDFRMGLAVTSKVRRRRSLVTEEFAYARGRATKPLKVTLPSPLILRPVPALRRYRGYHQGGGSRSGGNRMRIHPDRCPRAGGPG